MFGTSLQSYAQEAISNPIDIIVGTPKETIPGSGEVPPLPGDVRQEIINEFGITMNGFSPDHLRWSWEKFWEVSNTKFIDLVRGTTIRMVSGGSHQKDCRGSQGLGSDVDLQEFPESFFKFLLIHELGHIVRNCNNRETIQYSQHENAYIADGGGVSYYGNFAPSCTGSDNLSEDYADMIAYYLIPSAGESTVSCDPIPNRPNPFFSKTPSDFPAHLRVAESILKR